ncbi:hypothetical protein A8135_13635 [Legionella jamestowniensis]|uniref:Uncharacterized protein n=1 Tax=Legionella jamestowniensis TaxID=455 RepID=A0ABX2XTR9_9GAMM|nr:hypothetical protein A8135_13635 [Legionella jamestowniensis]
MIFIFYRFFNPLCTELSTHFGDKLIEICHEKDLFYRRLEDRAGLYSHKKGEIIHKIKIENRIVDEPLYRKKI